MAVPYHVKNFHIAETTDPDGIKRVHLDAHFINSNRQNISKDYWLVEVIGIGSTYTNADIINIISTGFSYAISNKAKVKVSVDKDHSYLYFYLPYNDGEEMFKFTGEEIK